MRYTIITVTGPLLSGSVIRKSYVELGNGSPTAVGTEALRRVGIEVLGTVEFASVGGLARRKEIR